MPIDKKQMTAHELEQAIRREYHDVNNKLSYMEIVEKYRSKYRSDFDQSDFMKGIKSIRYVDPTKEKTEAKTEVVQSIEIPKEEPKTEQLEMKLDDSKPKKIFSLKHW